MFFLNLDLLFLLQSLSPLQTHQRKTHSPPPSLSSLSQHTLRARKQKNTRETQLFSSARSFTSLALNPSTSALSKAKRQGDQGIRVGRFELGSRELESRQLDVERPPGPEQAQRRGESGEERKLGVALFFFRQGGLGHSALSMFWCRSALVSFFWLLNPLCGQQISLLRRSTGWKSGRRETLMEEKVGFVSMRCCCVVEKAKKSEKKKKEKKLSLSLLSALSLKTPHLRTNLPPIRSVGPSWTQTSGPLRHRPLCLRRR